MRRSTPSKHVIRTLAFGVAVSAALGADLANAQDTVFEVDHGLWRFTNTFTIPGMRVNNNDTITQCLTPQQSQRSLSEITGEMTGGEDSDCSISNISDLPGKISLDIACTSNAGGLQMRSTGRMAYEYDRTSYSGGATGEITVQGRTMPYSGQAEAVRIGDC
jgi:hypothetical protein